MKSAVTPAVKSPTPEALQEPGSARSVVLGTAGHIDHGKTALVLALTGTDTDRLPEEKSRGITIDLGFAALSLTDARGNRFDLSLIDVPGHHAFIRNMLAGAGGIDCVMLAVAADEGVKAQTIEHLTICGLLGIERGLVVLTKVDAVGAERLAEARAEVGRLVAGTFLEGAPVVATSAVTRAGIAELKAELVRLAAAVPERSRERVARLPLDRAFTVKGFGTVVTGTLQAGSLRAGASYVLEPGSRTVRVRGVQVHGAARAEVEAPNRVALNLAGVEVGEVQRGDIVVMPETLRAASTLDAILTPVPGAPALRHRSRVRVHAFAAESAATLLLYDDPQAKRTNGAVLGRLRLAKAMVLAPGDRFVVRGQSPAVTMAGGRVLDASPLSRQRRAAARVWLDAVMAADEAGQVLLRIARREMQGSGLPALVAETGLTAETLRRLLGPLVVEGEVVGAGEGAHLLTAEALKRASGMILAEVARAKGAVPAPELRSRSRLEDWVFQLTMRGLERGKQLAATPAGWAVPAAPGDEAPKGDPRLAAVEALYRRAGLASPILSEAAAALRIDPKQLPGLITELLRAKKLVRLGSDHLLMHAEAVAALRAELAKRRGSRIDVASFKTLTGLTRKHAIPLLEYLDGARVTRNDEGVRVIL